MLARNIRLFAFCFIFLVVGDHIGVAAKKSLCDPAVADAVRSIVTKILPPDSEQSSINFGPAHVQLFAKIGETLGLSALFTPRQLRCPRIHTDDAANNNNNNNNNNNHDAIQMLDLGDDNHAEYYAAPRSGAPADAAALHHLIYLITLFAAGATSVTLLFASQSIQHSLKPTTRRISCEHEIAGLIHDATGKLSQDPSANSMPCLSRWSVDNTEYSGCVPLGWVSLKGTEDAAAGLDHVCGVAANKEGEMEQWGYCLECDPCACSGSGNSGGVQTDFKGCGVHLEGTTSRFDPFCYVVGGGACESAKDSTLYLGARFKPCNIEEEKQKAAALSEAAKKKTSAPLAWLLNPINQLGTISQSKFSQTTYNLFKSRGTVLLISIVAVVCLIWLWTNMPLSSATELPPVEATRTRLLSLTSTEWKCVSGMTSCGRFEEFETTASNVLFADSCSNRFLQVVKPVVRSSFEPSLYDSEFTCGCDTCSSPTSWVPVMLLGRVQHSPACDAVASPSALFDPALNCFPVTVNVEFADNTGVFTIARSVFISGTISSAYGTVASKVLYQGIDPTTGQFRVTVPVFVPIAGSKKTPLIRLTVLSGLSRTQYQLFAPGTYSGIPIQS